MIEQGDSVFLYTYGVIEALDPIRLGVGRDRLRSIWARVGDSSPERAASAVLDEIDAFWRDVVPTQSIISVMTRPEAEALHKEVEAVRGGRVPRTGTALVVLGSCEAFNDAHLAPNARI
jgi:hypothetical protein